MLMLRMRLTRMLKLKMKPKMERIVTRRAQKRAGSLVKSSWWSSATAAASRTVRAFPSWARRGAQ